MYLITKATKAKPHMVQVRFVMSKKYIYIAHIYLVLHLNLPLGVIMYMLGGLKGNSLGNMSFP